MLASERANNDRHEPVLQEWTEWKQAIPEKLAAEDPRILSLLLTHANRETGVSGADLERELELKQPRISKFSKRLLDE
jgi:hypothetical protein